MERLIVSPPRRSGTADASDRGESMEEPHPQTEDTKPGDPPKEDWEGPVEPAEPPPESIPGDSGEAPTPSQD
jgi:hypothetical protein